MTDQHDTKPRRTGMSSYLKLDITLVVSFVIWYLLTFSIVNVIGDY